MDDGGLRVFISGCNEIGNMTRIFGTALKIPPWSIPENIVSKDSARLMMASIPFDEPRASVNFKSFVPRLIISRSTGFADRREYGRLLQPFR